MLIYLVGTIVTIFMSNDATAVVLTPAVAEAASKAKVKNPLPDIVRSAILIGVDLGPNLSVTGSLATILWLKELRRHGYDISAWRFLKLGLIIMIPALLVALLALLI